MRAHLLSPSEAERPRACPTSTSETSQGQGCLSAVVLSLHWAAVPAVNGDSSCGLNRRRIRFLVAPAAAAVLGLIKVFVADHHAWDDRAAPHGRQLLRLRRRACREGGRLQPCRQKSSKS